MEPVPRPTPLPRSTREGELKKPVPLPRSLKTPPPVKSSTESSPGRRMTQAVIDGTRNVGELFERKVRGMREKRKSEVRAVKPIKPDFARSQSLPTEDIFDTIQFSSPLVDNDDTVFPDDEVEELYYNPDLPPPMYPPPPLPDESSYDHVQFRTASTNLNKEIAAGTVIISKKRCEGEVPAVEIMEADTNTSNAYFEDPTSEEFSRTISFCSEALSLLDSDSDEDFTQHSSSSQSNDLYVNWESPLNTPTVPLRNANSSEHRQAPSNSVIFEFDPLYENIDNFSPAANNNYDQLSLSHTLTPYGMDMSSIDEWDEVDSGDDSPCPIAPPKRFDSITPTPDVTNVSTHPAKVSPSNTAPAIPPHPKKRQNTEHAPSLPPHLPKPPEIPPHPKKLASAAASTSQDTMLPEYASVQTELKKRLRLPNKLSQEQTSSQSNPPESPSQVPREGRESPVPVLSQQEDKTKHEEKTTLSKSQENLNTKGPLVRWSSMKKAMRHVADGSRLSMAKISNKMSPTSQASGSQCLDRPAVSGRPARHSGALFRGRDSTPRYCVLVDGRLTCYADATQAMVRDAISLSSVLSIQLIKDHRESASGDELYSWQLSTAWKGRSYELACNSSTERRVWMQKILESLTSSFSTRLTSDFTRAGWCFMKQGISGSWCSAWLLLTNRTLFYVGGSEQVQEIDLRKARCVDLQDCGTDCPKVTEPGQLIVVDHPGQSIYLITDLERETHAWRKAVKESSVENGPNLSQQQLTKDDIPTIVDKCISFVYAHGSMSEGIYRRNGSNSSVAQLLSKFRSDAWSVQLSRTDYSEFEVATVMKRFFRDLPESLLTTELHDVLCEIADSEGEKLEAYRKTLQRLEPINFLTLRKLLGHLHFIQEQKEKTLMTVKNLAAIWGPTLMHNEGQDSLGWSRLETAVVSDLLELYPKLFDVDQQEQQREQRMKEALERLHAANSSATSSRPSGDIKVWVHIGNRDSKNCVQVSISPQKLAGEVCSDLQARVNLPAHSLCLEEVVFGGALVRPMHHSERVLDVVLRWGYWKESQRRNNCLVLTKNHSLVELASVTSQLAAISGEMKFADPRARTFKNLLVEFAQAKLSVYKDKTGTVKLGEWKIEDIVWYTGHEPKRNPNCRWAITFIEKNLNATKAQENLFFGCVFAGTSREEQLRWTSALLHGQYQQNVLPKPMLMH